MRTSTEQFVDRVPSRRFLRAVAHGNIEQFRVRSLQQVADILNETSHGDRVLSASDVRRIECSALRKLRIRMGSLP